MKPRVFVSSTYFDLKHVRERLERFINNYYFEPVLFESDNVFFEHNQPLDKSCFNEVKLCHMMILIVGGRYGSKISGDETEKKIETYNNEYVSITRREFETAQKMNIPIFVFIDKNVYAEYHTYSKNHEFIDSTLEEQKLKKKSQQFSFAHVDDVNVFKFINTLRNNPIKTFEKVEDIENYLGNQIASLLYTYLQQLLSDKREEKILDSVAELKVISKKIDLMVNEVGKKVIVDRAQLEEVLDDQNKILIDFFVEKFAYSDIKFLEELPTFDYENSDRVAKVLMNKLFVDDIDELDLIISNWKGHSDLENRIQSEFFDIDLGLNIEKLDIYTSSSNYKKIFDLISSSKDLRNYLEKRLSLELYNVISPIF